MIHNINYDLGCRNCKSRRNGITLLRSDEPTLKLNRDELIAKMEFFREIICENCGISNWVCFNIFLNGDDNIYDQFILNAVKENGEINGGPLNDRFSRMSVNEAFLEIHSALNERKKRTEEVIKENGTLYVQVDFLSDPPYKRCTIFENDGFSNNEVEEFIEEIYAAILNYFDKQDNNQTL